SPTCLNCLSSPICCSAHLANADARRTRLLDYIRSAASARKRQHHFRLAFGQHLTIADRTSPAAKLPPIGVEDLHRHPLKSGPVVRCGVSALRAAVDQQRDDVPGMHALKGVAKQRKITKTAPATEQNSHTSCPPDSQYQYKMLGGRPELSSFLPPGFAISV